MEWESEPSVWTKALSLYKAAITHRETEKKKPNMQNLDAYIWDTLTPLVRSRKPPFLHANEYSKVVQWKLKRGRWRPRLQAFADDTTEDEVADASKNAFIALRNGNIKDALGPLIFLKGCGPATASAILAVADDDVPFMSDELLLAVQGEGKRQYTVKAYLALIDAVREKTDVLSKQAGFKWTAKDVEHAVFAAHFAESASSDIVKQALEVHSATVSSQNDRHVVAEALEKHVDASIPLQAHSTSHSPLDSVELVTNDAPHRDAQDAQLPNKSSSASQSLPDSEQILGGSRNKAPKLDEKSSVEVIGQRRRSVRMRAMSSGKPPQLGVELISSRNSAANDGEPPIVVKSSDSELKADDQSSVEATAQRRRSNRKHSASSGKEASEPEVEVVAIQKVVGKRSRASVEVSGVADSCGKEVAIGGSDVPSGERRGRDAPVESELPLRRSKRRR